jgi:DNA-binding transcriptional LysR family regulator
MKRLDLLGVQAFISIAESGSFNAAAAHLHVSQTALTRRLQKLEAALGLQLIERTTRSMTVTRVGMDFLPKAIRSVRELGTALDELKLNARQDEQQMLVGCLPTIAGSQLTSIIREYRVRHPRSVVQVFDRSATEIREAALRGELDFAISALDAPHHELMAERLFEEPLVAACPATHPLAGRSHLKWRELEGEPLIGIGLLSGNRRQTEQVISKEGLDLHFTLEVQHLATAVGLVCGGAGIAILPISALHGAPAAQLTAVPLVQPSVVRTISLFRRRDRPLSPSGMELSRMVAQMLGERRRRVKDSRSRRKC